MSASEGTNNFLKPLRKFCAESDQHFLCEHPISFMYDDECYYGKAKFSLKLVPYPELVLSIKIDQLLRGTGPHAFFVRDEKFGDMQVGETQIEGWLRCYSPAADGNSSVIEWILKKQGLGIQLNRETCFSRLVFHLFDFGDFSFDDVSCERHGDSSVKLSRIELYGVETKIQMNSLASTHSSAKQTKKDGIPRLSHVGEIVPVQTDSFSLENVTAIKRNFIDFLSFASGKKMLPVLIVGFDDIGNEAWHWMCSPEKGRKGGEVSWLDKQDPSGMKEFYSCFENTMKNESWRDVLNGALYWYYQASKNSSLDTGIVLIQTALELLSFNYCVNHRGLLTEDGFDKLRASDKLRIFFASLELDLAIPDDCNSLSNYAPKGRGEWLDFPHCFTEIRNSIVHPTNKKTKRFNREAYFEAWKCGMWFLELSILAICGYKGNHSHRLKKRWRGETEPVPWTKKQN